MIYFKMSDTMEQASDKAEKGDKSDKVSDKITDKVTDKVSDKAVSDKAGTDSNAGGEEDDQAPVFSLEGKKKKKKKKVEESESLEGTESGSGVPWEGSDRDYNYTELLERIFSLLREKNPTLAGGRKRHVMPPPQLVRVGTRKTMWANFAPICLLMHRQPEHAMSFLLAELGTEGSIDGNQRCVMKGRYVPKQIESILKKYITEYVTCHMCRNPETTLTRDSVTRLYFIQCEACGSRRSVAPIKSGFHATMRTDRRKVKDGGK